LTPRASFALWQESVTARSLPWTIAEREAALYLRTLVMDLVVSRAEELDALNSELASSNEELDAFAYIASHDLKEPLRGIHRHAALLRKRFKRAGCSTPRRSSDSRPSRD
jgi:light-regulated signal transduction histidine kinase (bacteriophytochrome)